MNPKNNNNNYTLSSMYLFIRILLDLKNLAPFPPIPVPLRPASSTDLESGRHFNSFKRANRYDNPQEISESLTLLQETTESRRSSFHDNRTASKPCVVSSEQPFRDKEFTLLRRNSEIMEWDSRKSFELWFGNLGIWELGIPARSGDAEDVVIESPTILKKDVTDAVANCK